MRLPLARACIKKRAAKPKVAKARSHCFATFSSPAALSEYLAWLDGGEVGLPPAMPVGGVGDLLPGAEAWMRVRLEPGRYALLCQVPSTSHGGRPHYKLGMVREFVVADSDRPPNDPKTN